ncbi:uncharacterized protein N7515_000309 [Penicillium bovifimosum]|uniref:Uncharacterized protein n=1 Tax=Penicillium bovifimosum TaxID=126998 RepID=A0A9W9HF60_9EURO|nr:uncharacterized protein N7515_000309 [Penicillium bovifimosum]KAJ5145745.1 hypothetical protein N7515_000309 [Penicillium bovifimosum]
MLMKEDDDERKQTFRTVFESHDGLLGISRKYGSLGKCREKNQQESTHAVLDESSSVTWKEQTGAQSNRYDDSNNDGDDNYNWHEELSWTACDLTYLPCRSDATSITSLSQILARHE